MMVDHELTPVTSLMYGFTRDSISPKAENHYCRRSGDTSIGYPSLHEIFNSGSQVRLSCNTMLTHFEGFMDSLLFLCMKFPTEPGIATIKDDQMRSSAISTS